MLFGAVPWHAARLADRRSPRTTLYLSLHEESFNRMNRIRDKTIQASALSVSRLSCSSCQISLVSPSTTAFDHSCLFVKYGWAGNVSNPGEKYLSSRPE